MIFQVVLHLLLDFEIFFSEYILFASLITLDKFIQYTWKCLFSSLLLLYLYAKYNSLLCLHDVLMPKMIQVLLSLLFLYITLFGGKLE